MFLLELQQSVLKKMKAGVQVKELYDFTVGEVQKKKPDLADKLVKSIGFGVSHASLVSDRSELIRDQPLYRPESTSEIAHTLSMVKTPKRCRKTWCSISVSDSPTSPTLRTRTKRKRFDVTPIRLFDLTDPVSLATPYNWLTL